MRAFLIVILALSATISAGCICGVLYACLHKSTYVRNGESVPSVWFRPVEVFIRELSGNAKRVFVIQSVSMLLSASLVIAGAFIYNACFFSERLFFVPAAFLLLSGILVFLLIRYYRYMQYLILCCAARVCMRKRQEVNADNSK